MRSIRSAAAILFCVSSCAVDRPRDEPGGAHPAGWIDETSAAFHGRWLRENGDPLDRCRECHGEDYAGGAVGSSCLADCHESGPEACGTCHGQDDDPRPDTGAHAAHATGCETCHAVTARVESPAHIDGDGVAEVRFSGLAVEGGARPAWDGATGRCADTYCHQAASPPWSPAVPVGCDSCHGAPPTSHARFQRVATEDGCVDCHPSGARHLDGVVDLALPSGCDTCHGRDETGAPPPALDGAEDPADPGVGAHRRHLDAALPDRIGYVARCDTCHPVPSDPLAEGHIDAVAPADVVLPQGGAFDAAAATCIVGCHWDRDPGPAWTDDSGGGRACGSCHDMPPERTRAGRAHPSSAPGVEACRDCHSFDPAAHVDGEVDF